MVVDAVLLWWVVGVGDGVADGVWVGGECFSVVSEGQGGVCGGD